MKVTLEYVQQFSIGTTETMCKKKKCCKKYKKSGVNCKKCPKL